MEVQLILSLLTFVSLDHSILSLNETGFLRWLWAKSWWDVTRLLFRTGFFHKSQRMEFYIVGSPTNFISTHFFPSCLKILQNFFQHYEWVLNYRVTNECSCSFSQFSRISRSRRAMPYIFSHKSSNHTNVKTVFIGRLFDILFHDYDIHLSLNKVKILCFYCHWENLHMCQPEIQCSLKYMQTY